MIIECPACSSRYRIREDKLPGTGGNIKCPNCAHIFFVAREGPPGSGSYSSVSGASSAVDAGPVDDSTARGVGPAHDSGGDRKWKLRNPVGLIYDFPTTEQLRTWLASRENFDGIQVTYDGSENWLSVTQFAELADVQPTGRKSLLATTGPLGAGRATPQISGTASPGPSGSFPASEAQIREEAEARLKEARANRNVTTSNSVAVDFRYVKPPATRQAEQTSIILLFLAVLVLPAIAAIGLHIVGVIDLTATGLLGQSYTPRVPTPVHQASAATDEERPRRIELSTDETVTVLISQASNALARNEPEAAIEHLEQAAELDPTAGEIWCQLATLYSDAERMNDFERASERCEASEDGSGAAAPPSDTPPGDVAAGGSAPEQP